MPKGQPFRKGDPRINRAGRKPLTKAIRAALRNGSPRVVEALVQLVENGGPDAGIRASIGMQLLEAAWGRAGVDGWLGRREVLEEETEEVSTGTDLTQEIRLARERAAELQARLREMGEAAQPALRKAYNEAVDLVRRLCATQAEYNPGMDARGDFTVELDVKGGATTEDTEVPDLVADRHADEQLVTDEPTHAAAAHGAMPGTGNSLVDGVEE